MSSRFRPTEPGDAEAISRFMQLVFGMAPDHPGLGLRQMEWKYWQPHPEWDGVRGYVMERDGLVVAHGSVVPLTCLWGDRRIRMVDLIDWAAHPDHPGAGITLLKKVSQMVEGVFIAGGTEMAQKVFRSLGFRESNPATKFALPFRPIRRFFADPEPGWKRPARVFRNSAWLAKARMGVPDGWAVRPIGAGDLESSQIPMPRPSAQAAVFERNSRNIGFVLNCPATPMAAYAVSHGNRICGYFVLAYAVRQCRIAEAWIEPNTPENWDFLYQIAAKEAQKRSEILEIITVLTHDQAAREGLSRAGFRPRGEIPLRFSMKGDYPVDIRYQLADNDSGYLHDGTTAYWT